MKKIYLALLAAALVVPIQMQAVNYEVKSINREWAATTNLPPSYAKGMAISKGRIFTAQGGDATNWVASKKIWFAKNGTWTSFDAQANVSWAITNDDEGNILYYHGGNIGGNKVQNELKIGVLPASSAESGTEYKIITIPEGKISVASTVTNSGRADYFGAYGNILSGAGALYFMPNGEENIVKISTNSLALAGNPEYYDHGTLNSANSYPKVTPWNGNKVMMHHQGDIAKMVTLNSSTKKADVVEEMPFQGKNGMLLISKKNPTEKQFYIYPSNLNRTSPTTNSSFIIKNVVTGLQWSPETSVYSGSYSISAGNVMLLCAEFDEADDNVIYVYCYLPGKGAWKYKVTIAPDVVLPAAPKLSAVVNADADGKQYATLSWNMVAGAESYTVQQYVNNAWVDWQAGLKNGTNGVISVTNPTALTANWTVRVLAINAGGSTPSNQVTAAYQKIVAPVAKIEKVDNGTTKDAKISWNAVNGAASYSIEKSADGKTGWSALASGLTAQTYTDPGVQNVTSAFYRIYAVDVSGVKSAASNLVSVWPAFEPHYPTITLDNFDGYSKVELTWSAAGNDAPKATGYNIYRDGVCIAENIEVVHYLDQNVPEGNHIYYITAIYADKPGVEGKSNEVETHVFARNPANVRYELTEIYNYPIINEAGNAFSNANNTTGAMKYAYNQDAWRQGKLHKEADGSYWWYIAQLVDVETGQYETTYTEGKGGGVIRIKADPNPSSPMASSAPQLMANSAQRILTYDADASTGLAMDSKGNIFVRQRTGYATTADDGKTWTLDGLTYGKPSPYAFANSFHKARIYQRTGEASGSNPPTYNNTYKPLNLEALGFYDPADEEKDIKGNWINKLGYRCDYYAAVGDIYGGTGEIYLMPSSYTPATAVKLVMNNGSVSQIIKSVDSQGKMSGTESFFFPVLPNDSRRNDNIIQSRSNGYYNVPDDPASGSTTVSFDLDDAVYATNSRINNAGGTTRWWNNDMFMITPESAGSKNTVHPTFRVIRQS